MTPNTHWEHILGSNPISRVEILGRAAKGIRRIEEHIPWSVDGHQVQIHRFILKSARRNLISSNTQVEHSFTLVLRKHIDRISGQSQEPISWMVWHRLQGAGHSDESGLGSLKLALVGFVQQHQLKLAIFKSNLHVQLTLRKEHGFGGSGILTSI